MGRRACRERLRWRGGGTPRQRWALASLGFNGFTEMLHEMPAVGDLHRVRGALGHSGGVGFRAILAIDNPCCRREQACSYWARR